MTVGLAVCALIVGLALACSLRYGSLQNGVLSRGQVQRGNHSAWPARNSGGAVYLFWPSQLLLTLSDGFTINLGFVQSQCRWTLRTSTLARSFVVSSSVAAVCRLCLANAARRVESVPVGQWESGQALGLSKSAIFSVW